jgi:trimethylamine--corrinoid protein Co-methyltransferase
MQRFEYFTDDDVQKIHEATLRVLETVGVDFGYEPAVEVFKKAGCKVDGERVFFCSQDGHGTGGQGAFRIYPAGAQPGEERGDRRRQHRLHSLLRSSLCPRSGSGRRESTLEDYTNFVKLSYASKSIDITGGMMAEPNDIPHERRNAEMMARLHALFGQALHGRCHRRRGGPGDHRDGRHRRSAVPRRPWRKRCP